MLISPLYGNGELERAPLVKQPKGHKAPPSYGFVQAFNGMSRHGQFIVTDPDYFPIATKSVAIINAHLDKAWRASSRKALPYPSFSHVTQYTREPSPRKVLLIVRNL